VVSDGFGVCGVLCDLYLCWNAEDFNGFLSNVDRLYGLFDSSDDEEGKVLVGEVYDVVSKFNLFKGMVSDGDLGVCVDLMDCKNKLEGFVNGDLLELRDKYVSLVKDYVKGLDSGLLDALTNLDKLLVDEDTASFVGLSLFDAGGFSERVYSAFTRVIYQGVLYLKSKNLNFNNLKDVKDFLTFKEGLEEVMNSGPNRINSFLEKYGFPTNTEKLLNKLNKELRRDWKHYREYKSFREWMNSDSGLNYFLWTALGAIAGAIVGGGLEIITAGTFSYLDFFGGLFGGTVTYVFSSYPYYVFFSERKARSKVRKYNAGLPVLDRTQLGLLESCVSNHPSLVNEVVGVPVFEEVVESVRQEVKTVKEPGWVKELRTCDRVRAVEILQNLNDLGDKQKALDIIDERFPIQPKKVIPQQQKQKIIDSLPQIQTRTQQEKIKKKRERTLA